MHDELPVHLAAALVLAEVAVDRKGPGLVGAELEAHRLPAADPLGDAVRIDGEAVRDVAARERHADQIVEIRLDPGRLEGVLPRDDREAALLRRVGIVL